MQENNSLNQRLALQPQPVLNFHVLNELSKQISVNDVFTF